MCYAVLKDRFVQLIKIYACTIIDIKKKNPEGYLLSFTLHIWGIFYTHQSHFLRIEKLQLPNSRPKETHETL